MAPGGRRRGRVAVLALAGGILAAGAVVAVVLVMAVMIFAGSAADPSPGGAAGCGDGNDGVTALPVQGGGPRVATLDGDQTGNARTIVQVAASISAAQGMDAASTRRAAIIAIMTAMQESTLRNLDYGDRDSLGLFQQRAAWASAAERRTPSAAATMFFTGGHAGQPGLFSISGWQSMPLWAAAQAVQVSAFPTAYAKWERTATAVVGSLLGGGTPVRAVAAQAPAPSPSPAPSPGATLAVRDVSCALGGGSLDGTLDAPAQPSTKGWVLPLPKGSYTPTSPFGWRVHPILHDWRLHTGQDLGAPTGTPVFAAAVGRVVVAGPDGGYGNVVVVEHADGVQTYYGHLSAILVPVGAAVTAGQQVGRVGSTGTSTGAHLHFEVRLRGQPIDPVPFMRDRGVRLLTPAPGR